MPTNLPPEVLAELKARHLAFLRTRLVSARAEADWRAAAPAVFDELLAARVADVLDLGALEAALNALLTPETIERAVRPLSVRILPVVLRELRDDKSKLEDHVPAATRQKLDTLLSRPGTFPDHLVREIAEQEAIEQVMHDVLFDGLKEFAEKVNPFIAEWGIPSLLKRMSPFGGAIARGLETMRADFDRRMEPEIRRFLKGFTRKGLRRMAELAIAQADQPPSIAVRKHLLAWLLEHEIAALVSSTDAEAIALGQEIGLDLLAEDHRREDRRAQRSRLLAEAFAAAKDQTVGEALAKLGVTLVPDFEAVAAATWPLVKTAMKSDAVRRWLEAMVGEFYDEAP